MRHNIPVWDGLVLIIFPIYTALDVFRPMLNTKAIFSFLDRFWKDNCFSHGELM